MKMSVNKSLIVILSMTVVILTSCNPAKKWEKEEKQQIREYLLGLGDTVYVTKPSGLIYINLVEGTGQYPKNYDTISIRYKGSFMSGRVFGSNLAAGDPLLTYIVGTGYLIDGPGALIEGLAEGGKYIREGGKGKFVTPSSLAYGPNGYGIISGFTPLLWEIEIVDLRPVSGK